MGNTIKRLAGIVILLACVQGGAAPLVKQDAKDPSTSQRYHLMYQAFVYAGDLENAYRVIEKALQKDPSSRYWHQKGAEVAGWLNKPSKVFEHRLFLYQQTGDNTLAGEIIAQGVENYQYEKIAPLVKEQVMASPTKENVERLIFVYNQLGIPEEAAALLESLFKGGKRQTLWLAKALEIYIDSGEEEAIERLVKQIDYEKIRDMEVVEKLVSYYTSMNRLDEAYQLLLEVDEATLQKQSVRYYQMLSDYAWYLKEVKVASRASKRLFVLGQERVGDYERILLDGDEEEDDFMGRVALKGAMRLHNAYLYRVYLNALFRQKRYEELKEALGLIAQTEWLTALRDDLALTMMQGQLYRTTHQEKLAWRMFQKAMKIAPSSTTKATLLWFLIDHKMDKELQALIASIESGNGVDSSLWMPLAVGYFTLQNSDKAVEYLERLRAQKSNSIDVDMLYAYAMQAREQEGVFMQTMRSIYMRLDQELQRNPSRLKHAKFLEHYLASGLYFMAVDAYEKLLNRSRGVLSHRRYVELSISHALRHHAYARAERLISQLKEISPWMHLTIALNREDRRAMDTLLERYQHRLPIRDRVVAAVKTGNRSLAETLAFEGMEHNQFDGLLYKQRLDLITEGANRAKMETGYLNRGDSLTQVSVALSNRYALGQGWYLKSRIGIAKNSNVSKQVFQNVPSRDTTAMFAFEKKFEKSEMTLKAGVRRAMQSYVSALLKAAYQPFSKLTLKAQGYYGQKAEETTYLLLGGYKNGAKLEASWQFFPSLNASLQLGYDQFFSQDVRYLGEGYYGRVTSYQQLRAGYPDMAWGSFVEFGSYVEGDSKDTLLHSLQPFSAQVLPEKFYNIGLNLQYGASSMHTLSHDWRPYMVFSPYYTSVNSAFNFSLEAGIGGHLYDKDRMVVKGRYNRAVNGTDEASLNMMINYQWYY